MADAIHISVFHAKGGRRFMSHPTYPVALGLHRLYIDYPLARRGYFKLAFAPTAQPGA